MAARGEALVFYGWVIVCVAFAALFVANGTVFYPYGILAKPIADELGGSRLLASLGLPLVIALSGLSGPWVGRLVDRHSIRVVMLVGAAALCAGFLALSVVHSPWGVWLAYGGLLAPGMALVGGIPSTKLVVNWFVRRRGTALGIAQTGISLSGAVTAWVASWLVVSVGWRGTARVFALVPVVILAPLVLGFAVTRPEDRGLRPDGERGAIPSLDADAEALRAARAWPVRRVLREPALWLIAVVVGLNFASNSAVLVHVHPFVTDQGYPAAHAAGVLSLMALCAALGKPVFGWLADRVNRRGAMALAIALQVAGLLGVLRATAYPALLAAGVVFGLGYGGVIPVWGVLTGAVFGRAVFGRVLGLMGPIMIPFQTFGLVFTAWMFDRLGSYEAAFTTFLLLYTVAAGLLLLLRIPAEAPDLAPAAARSRS